METTVQIRTKKSKDTGVRRSKQNGKEAEDRTKYRRAFERIIRDISKYTQNPPNKLLRQAFDYAFYAHRDQMRKSGNPYIEHCIQTARILTELRMDAKTIAAGVLHDVVEDTGIGIDEVSEKFGPEIAHLVDGVTKISELKFQSLAEEQAENFRKMILSMAQDLRVIMIKFADRLHNMRTLEFLPEEKAKRIARETREVYAPLAHRFGIARIKWELEDLSLKILEPEAYDELTKKIVKSEDKQEKIIRKVAGPIRRELSKQGIEAQITGRVKTLYSIYRKMKQRNTPFEEIYDILAVRIIVDKVDACYFALGVVHTLFQPVHDRFKDYIATPKLNMYQSLHTSVIGPEGRMVEIQVRTEEMHRVAEIGIAAHWKYKEGRQSDNELDRYSAWLREMVDWQKDSLEPEEYLDILKTGLFISEVFVFTPHGDLLKLPIGSTPVDFAFAVHTDIGMHCIGAKVNGRIVPLNSKLSSGDSIEIITSSNQKPHRDWLTFVRTSKAKSKIKKWLREQQFQEAVKLGEEILTKGLKKTTVSLKKESIRELASQLGYSSVEQLYLKLGQGEISLRKVIEKVMPGESIALDSNKKENVFERFVSRARGSVKGIRVQGIDNLLIRFAQCCHPVPGDTIVGFITKGRGIVVHRRDCQNAVKLMEYPERNIEVEWDVEKGKSFMVQLRILAEGRKEFLKDVSESISSMNTNILKVDMDTENGLITAYLILEVKDLSHLTRTIRRLYRLKGILSVERTSDGEKMREKSKHASVSHNKRSVR